MPAHRNIRALNIAWVIRWKKVHSGRLRARLIIITPSWLRVDSAMIFLRSFSMVAAILAIRIVSDDIIKR